MTGPRYYPKRLFVLIHSPLVGPATWALVADELRRQGFNAVVPALESSTGGPRPYWRQHVDQIIGALRLYSPETPLILVGHSGGGMLLPLIRQETHRPVSAYIFVDAGIPQDGKSRLDLFESPEAADNVRQSAAGGFLPVWSDEDLREVIPDDEVRRSFVAELHPLPLAVYEEPIPVFAGWPDAPVTCVRFGQNPAYDADEERARREGWPVVQMEGQHFHMLVKPEEVADSLWHIARELHLLDS